MCRVVMVKGVQNKLSEESICYPVEVNYDLPIEEIIKRSRFTSIDPKLNSENFPLPKAGKDRIIVQLVRIRNRIVLGDQDFEMEAEAVVYEKGLQFVNVWEMLSAFKQHQNLRAVVPIFAPGSSADIGDGLYIPGVYDQYSRPYQQVISLVEV